MRRERIIIKFSTFFLFFSKLTVTVSPSDYFAAAQLFLLCGIGLGI